MRKVADCSFVHFVYPFLFDAAKFDDRATQLETVTCKSGTKANEDIPMWIPLWKEKGFPRDDMLAYVANFLNPKKSKQATARFWKLNDNLDEAFGLASCADWQLVKKEKKKEKVIPFRFGEVGSGSDSLFAVQLALFRVGVGFLTIRARPESNEVDDWLDFISNFRFVKGQRQFTVRATKRVKDRDTHQIEDVDFFPALAVTLNELEEVDTDDEYVTSRQLPKGTDGSKRTKKEQRLFIQILDAMLHSGSLNAGEKTWWEEVFIPEQLIPFAIVYVDEETEDNKAELPQAGTGKVTYKIHENDNVLLEKQRQEDIRLIYMLRNFFHSSQGINPAPEDLASDHPSLIPYAARCWFIFSLDGGSFLACDAPHEPTFFRQTMPDHLRDQYFLLLLIVLHQRFALMCFSQDVVTKWLTEQDEEKRIAAFRRIRERLLGFTAHGLFTQVMQREHHHRSYRKWQEVFQINDLYGEVRDEVREMHAALEERREKYAQKRSDRLERTIGLLGICFGVPALVIGFLGINIPGVTTENEGLRIWLGLVIVLGSSMIFVVTILLLLRRYINKAVEEKIEEEKKEAKE